MKIINTETLIERALNIPRITGICDLVSKKNDGTVTPYALIKVTGHHLSMCSMGNVRLCLVPALDDSRLIEICNIHILTDATVIVSLPDLKPGEYFPAVKIPEVDGEDALYILPESWVVKSHSDRLSVLLVDVE